MSEPKVYTAISIIIPYQHSPRDIEQYMMVFEKDSQTWGQPGGGLEPTDADYIHAATREAEQETGLVVVPNYFIGIYTATSRKGNIIHIAAVSANIQSGCFKTKRDTDIGEVRPYTLEDLRELERKDQLRTRHYNVRVVEDFIRQRERRELIPIERMVTQIR